MPVPQFRWNPINPLIGQAVTFTDATTGPHHIYHWIFPNASTGVSTANSLVVTWTKLGPNTVTLVVTNNGQAYSVQHTVS